MAKIFISHSSEDKKLVDEFDEFLTGSFVLAEDEIFYSSRHGGLLSGTDFINAMKTEIENCMAVIFIISKNFMQSSDCLAELGAAWVLNKNVYPFAVYPTNYEAINETPLLGHSCPSIQNEMALRDFGDALRKKFRSNSSNTFEKKLSYFRNKADEIISNLYGTSEEITGKDSDNTTKPLDNIKNDQINDPKESVPHNQTEFTHDSPNNTEKSSSERHDPFDGEDDDRSNFPVQCRSNDYHVIHNGRELDSSSSVPDDQNNSTSLLNQSAKTEPQCSEPIDAPHQTDCSFRFESEEVESYISGLEARVNKCISWAEFLLGLAYYDGIIVKRDLLKAFDLIQTAAERGYTEAQIKLAEMYFWGSIDNGRPDYYSSTNWLADAVSGDDPQALFSFGWMFLNDLCDFVGFGEWDLDEAEMYFKKAAEYGNDNSYRFLEKIQQLRMRTQDLLDHTVNSANEGNVNDMMKAGLFYREGGSDFEPDRFKAYKFFNKAAKAGSVEAEREIGKLLFYYSDQLGFVKNTNSASHHFKIAARAGDMVAQFYLGVMFLWGFDGKTDNTEAKKWFKLAADQGHVMSQLYLGNLYAQLDNPDYDAAFKMFQSAAKQGSAEAERQLRDLNRFVSIPMTL